MAKAKGVARPGFSGRTIGRMINGGKNASPAAKKTMGKKK